MKCVLSIAGSDPSGGAGIQVDLLVFRSLSVQGLSVVTAVTAQNDKRFYSLNPVPSTLLREQLRAVLQFKRPDAIKIGMLGTEGNVLAVFRFLESEKFEAVVLDPVQQSSTGAVLLPAKGMAILKDFLIPKVTVVTPNLDEARTLTGLKVRTIDQMKEAALNLYDSCRGVKAVLLKGGHLEGDPIDVLYDGREWHLFEPRERLSHPVHGTGCAHSAALAAYLARGESIPSATRKAKRYVTAWMRSRGRPVRSSVPAP